MSLGVRARGFLELTRPGNAIAAGVLTFTGAIVAGGTLEDTLVVVAAILATVFATGAGNAVNDYFDRDIDRINRPDRPIPRGAVSADEAKWFSIALFGGAVVSALVLPLVAIAIAVVNLTALVAYTEFLKGLPGVGNVVVAALTGSTFLFGGAAIGAPLGAVVLSVLAALATLTREIVKDVEDIAGDKEEGLRTLPIVVGERPSLVFGTVVLVVAVLASAVPYLDGEFGLAYLGLVVPADVLMLAGTIRSFEDPTLAQRRLKHGMFLAAAAFIVGRVAALGGVSV
ncbi:geranylgeranylglycerol-phosphate geranylgeranyltransferase [Haloferax larsenii]|uniref:Digeranylgeranylglyceryl phosphate synthase n=1 Tax=Haloferax larsenii TaxID=302484 RepID=A0A1H7J817_HALLR|nr:geranylgeranylglycerol-phosphate geranylgeranyltransferase [Haloferax larsenii]SEK70871.1 geranylgeranylglycerol-phosphate geranylgeranyltransferase [Haloferax larsenii]